MQAVTARDRAAGVAGLALSDIPHPHMAENDVIVRVYAAGFIRTELDWPGTWTDRAGHDRAPSVPVDGRAIFFVVEPDRFRLAHLAERVRSGRLKPIIGAVRPLAEVPSAFAPDHRVSGKTIIRVTEGE